MEPMSSGTSIPQIMNPIFEADKTRSSMQVATQIAKCCLKYNLTFQQIETELRAKNCWTYLIARRRNESHTYHVRFEFPKGTLRTYNLFLSTRNKDDAMKELFEESATYKENFAKLADTGFIICSPNIPLTSQFKSGTLELAPGYKPQNKATVPFIEEVD